jgi:hypothetical protein
MRAVLVVLSLMLAIPATPSYAEGCFLGLLCSPRQHHHHHKHHLRLKRIVVVKRIVVEKKIIEKRGASRAPAQPPVSLLPSR